MNASKAKRRWMKWSRYVVNTGTRTTAKNSAGNHRGHARAYEAAMFAGRSYPRGARQLYFAKWMVQ